MSPMPLLPVSLAALLTLGGVALSPVQAADDGQARLPLSKVVLFNSGVGFYEHQAEIDGDATVELKFNVDDVNDLLKSMVLRDLGGGRISTVNYASKDPITRTLKTFAIDLTENPTLAELLEQIRGEQVRIEAPNAITGSIIGVEPRRQKVGDEIIETDVLNLLTDAGLRSVNLETVGSIQLLNPELDAELRQALTILAMGHATDKKAVTLNFLGEGKRPVRVGYIQESPVWKTSYRLELDDNESPFLQGWAIVENTTEEDWKDVNLTLVSGRPISFVMDLYQPLYVERPVVVPELFASLRPQKYGQDLAEAEEEFLAEAKGESAALAGKPVERQNRRKAAEEDRAEGLDQFARRGRALGVELQQAGVQSVAQAGDVGELFQYVIDTPVTLPRQQSAMLPIVNDAVQGQKVSIYNQAVQPKHPLSGLKLKNTTELHLMQGPITVFDGGAYAGDAQIEDLQPGTERLISYALDLDTEVAPESKPAPDQLVSCKLVKGTMHTSTKHQRTQHYTIKNSGRRAKTVLVEQPLDPSWTLIAPKEPDEKTRNLYRFAVTAEPGKPAKLEVQEERVLSQQIALGNMDDNTIRYYINTPVTSDKVKEALQAIIDRKQKLSVVAAERQQLEQRITEIGAEQDRIRQNMAQLDKNTDLYNRYVKKFGEQEDMIEKLRGQIAELTAEETSQRQALDEFLIGLDLS